MALPCAARAATLEERLAEFGDVRGEHAKLP